MYTQNTQTHKELMPDLIWELVYHSYRRAAEYLHGPDAVTRKPEFTAELLALLGLDFRRYKSVSVAGSKGKGSTSVCLASILQASGERVGFISSPEMQRFNERIRIDGRSVSDEVLLAAAEKIAPAVRALTARLEPPDYLGPGGVILALGATIFAEAGVTTVVVEAGRGGEYDESRLVEADISVLAPIMLEHPDKLGDTVQEIARTKTRITAPGHPIITAPQTDEVQAIIEEVARQLGSPVLSSRELARIEAVRRDPTGVLCVVHLPEKTYRDLRIALPGQHQAENAAVAILAAHQLAQYGAQCTDTGIREGLQRVYWPGRAQTLQQHPWAVLDGAINREAAAHICEIVQDYPARRITAVVCVPRPKDLDGLCEQIAQIADRIILTEVPAPMLSWYEDAATIAGRHCEHVEMIPDTEQAFRQALQETAPDEGLLLLGTQTFVGAALHFWKIDTDVVYQAPAQA